MSIKVTDKQVSYILSLARKNGMSTEWMNSTWKQFASCRERSGKVVDFLQDLDKARASEIIEALK